MTPLILNLLFCGGTLLLLATTLRLARGTTLVAPIAWSMGAVSSLAIAQAVLFFPPIPGVTSWQSLVRFVSGTLLLLPAISLLGAKRPQAIVWNYIVASLWVVLILPAGEVLLLKPQQTFELYAFGPWLIAGLIVMTAIHHAGTRMTLPGLLIASAQILYLSPFLPFVGFDLGALGMVLACGLFFLAAILARLLAPKSGSDALGLAWTRFQFAYGTAWTLRLIQRLDELQARGRWPVRLGWSGVEVIIPTASSEEIAEGRRALARALRSLLLRFVSPAWIEPFSAAELRRKPAQTVSTDGER